MSQEDQYQEGQDFNEVLGNTSEEEEIAPIVEKVSVKKPVKKTRKIELPSFDIVDSNPTFTQMEELVKQLPSPKKVIEKGPRKKRRPPPKEEEEIEEEEEEEEEIVYEPKKKAKGNVKGKKFIKKNPNQVKRSIPTGYICTNEEKPDGGAAGEGSQIMLVQIGEKYIDDKGRERVHWSDKFYWNCRGHLCKHGYPNDDHFPQKHARKEDEVEKNARVEAEKYSNELKAMLSVQDDESTHD